ncbi:hypothetical protein PV10_03781 [Exophiala mesophila]|uniref:VOC domain-containing protein n=1 Tax=Exophiala mesophila TaxID=212818 RepID=A0A0D1ZCT4_EXOME|nr:uncharacterized protein PV10_03781 [Exophiala mesophila]KIV92487.1 hypothetical protein PV10_03781 [Exophiala mesophila]
MSTSTPTADPCSPRRPSPPTHVLETALQVQDVVASTKFYKDLLGIEPDLNTPRMSTFPLGNTTLLLFQLNATADDSVLPESRGTIPGHGPSDDILALLNQTQTTETGSSPAFLKQHFCLAVPSRADVETWERYMAATGVHITGTVDWPRGGRSVYFADLDGNVGEVGSRGIWAHY